MVFRSILVRSQNGIGTWAKVASSQVASPKLTLRGITGTYFWKWLNYKITSHTPHARSQPPHPYPSTPRRPAPNLPTPRTTPLRLIPTSRPPCLLRIPPPLSPASPPLMQPPTPDPIFGFADTDVWSCWLEAATMFCHLRWNRWEFFADPSGILVALPNVEGRLVNGLGMFIMRWVWL